ncbi:hypothetical protein VNO77_12737 [Canavalia gladiata]|uniref:Uncharacterized protein n=1 Tax=Canavalia gladiata TaxID=3824 RepID=A0AAN9LXN9_CANGL
MGHGGKNRDSEFSGVDPNEHVRIISAPLIFELVTIRLSPLHHVVECCDLVSRGVRFRHVEKCVSFRSDFSNWLIEGSATNKLCVKVNKVFNCMLLVFLKTKQKFLYRWIGYSIKALSIKLAAVLKLIIKGTLDDMHMLGFFQVKITIKGEWSGGQYFQSVYISEPEIKELVFACISPTRSVANRLVHCLEGGDVARLSRRSFFHQVFNGQLVSYLSNTEVLMVGYRHAEKAYSDSQDKIGEAVANYDIKSCKNSAYKEIGKCIDREKIRDKQTTETDKASGVGSATSECMCACESLRLEKENNGRYISFTWLISESHYQRACEKHRLPEQEEIAGEIRLEDKDLKDINILVQALSSK